MKTKVQCSTYSAKQEQRSTLQQALQEKSGTKKEKQPTIKKHLRIQMLTDLRMELLSDLRMELL